ncbi:MAG: hypothetical protein WCH99_04085 [Verrucomicrobiota bacterium]
MNINSIAADIARRRKEMAEDSAENVEQLIIGMLSAEVANDKSAQTTQQLTACADILKNLNSTFSISPAQDLALADVVHAIRHLTQKIVKQ